MTDTLPIDIQLGYDPQTAFDIKLDTAKTLDEVFNRPSSGFGIDYVSSEIPTSNNSYQTPDNLTFEDAILSNDPNIRNIAITSLKRSSQKDPYTSLGLGATVETPYEYAEKYIDKQFGFDALNPDIEDYYYQNEYMADSWFARTLKNVFVRFPSRIVVGAATKFGEGLGYVASIGKNLIDEGIELMGGAENNFWEDVADNTFSKIMKEADEDFRNHIAPVYKQAGFDEKGLFSKLGDWTFWNDSVADALAFMGSALLPAGVASKAGWLTKGSSLALRSNNLLANSLKTGLRNITGSRTYGEVGLVAFNTANEAAFEATDRYKQAKSELLTARRNGENNLSDEEINEQAGRQASETFGWNMAALMLSNAWEMKNIIRPILGRSGNPKYKNIGISKTGRAILPEVTSKFVKGLTDRGKFYGGKIITSSLVEGFWEENIQLAIQRSAAEKYERKEDGILYPEIASTGLFGIIEQFAKQTGDLLAGKDEEALESVGLGALVGIIGGVGGSKFGSRQNPETGSYSFFLGERRQRNKETAVRAANINNAWNNIFDIRDVKNTDGSVNKEKLVAKIKAMEHLVGRQEILEQLNRSSSISKQDYKVLQNRLLNEYIKSLARVDKVQDAIDRIEGLSNRDVETNKEAFTNNPAEVASYVKEVDDIYKQIQSQNIQLNIPEGYTINEVEQITQTRKDEAFTRLADRRAMKPAFDHFDFVISENNKLIHNQLQSLLGSEHIEEALANSKATTYIEAISQKKTHESLKKQDVPQFVKDYHQSKIDEANNTIKKLNDLLGDSAPVIKNNNIFFKDKVIDFNSKTLRTLTKNYQTVSEQRAELEAAQSQNEVVANRLLDPETGFQTYLDLIDFLTKKAETKPVSDTPPVVTPPVTPASRVKTKDTTPKTSTEDVPVQKEVVITNEGISVSGLSDKPSINHPITFETPNISSTNDTNRNTELPSDVEQLRDIPYDEIRKLFIQEFMSDPSFNSNYKLFIVKDTFSEIYRPGFNNEVPEDYTPSGEVIIVERLDGTRPTFGDFFKNRHKKFSNLPIVFSFNQEMFHNYLLPERKTIYTQKYLEDPTPFYDSELNMSKEARKLVNSGTDKVQVDLIGVSGGVMPSTKVGRVIDRFGEDFDVSVTISDTNDKKKGQIFVNFGATSFPVGTASLQSSPTDLSNILNILNKSFPTKEEAIKVIQDYLEKIFYTNEDIFFRVVSKSSPTTIKVEDAITQALKEFPEAISVVINGESFAMSIANWDGKILLDENNQPIDITTVEKVALQNGKVFYDNTLSSHFIELHQVAKEHQSEPRLEKLKLATQVQDIGKLRFNVSRSGMKDGISVYDPKTNSFIRMEGEDYIAFIKDKLVTSLKKTIDKDGKLYMKPVNAHFSYRVYPSIVKKDVETSHQENYNKIVGRIKQLSDSNDLSVEKLIIIQNHINNSLTKDQLSKDQADKLLKRLDQIKTLKEAENQKLGETATNVLNVISTELSKKPLIINPDNQNEYVEVTKTGKVKKNSPVYQRASNVNSEGGITITSFDNKEASDRGTIIDTLFRQFLLSEISTVPELKVQYNTIKENYSADNFNDNFLTQLFDIFVDIKIKTPSLELISNTKTLWGEIKGTLVAGTIDTLAIDKNNGNLFIIDTKTSTQNRRNTSSRYYTTYLEKDQNQQSVYFELFKQRTGITPSGVFILPLQVTKKGGEYDSIILNEENEKVLMKVKLNPKISSSTEKEAVKTTDIPPIVTETPKTKKDILKNIKKTPKKDINTLLGNVSQQASAPLDYLVTVNGVQYKLGSNGRIQKGFHNTFIGMMTGTDTYGAVLDEMVNTYPFKKNLDGTVTGIYYAELEGKDSNIKAYGLPVQNNADVFTTQEGIGIVKVDLEDNGLEVSPLPYIKSQLTEKGLNQLENFLSRNC